MKKVLFIAAFAAVSLTSSAQFAKGDSYISGNVGFTSSSKKLNSTTTVLENKTDLSVSPNYGYFVTNNIAVGVGLGYGMNTTKNDATGAKIVDGSTLSAGVFARYYTTPAKAFSFFGNLGVNYTSGTEKLPTSVKTTGFDVAIAPGISYFVSNRLAIESTIGSLGYSTKKRDVTGAVASSDFGLNLNLSSIRFGAVYKF